VIDMVIRIPMSEKEIREARMSNIPEYIIGKMAQGYELNEKEKEIVNSMGKVYVLGHVKDGGLTKVQPQLRDLPFFETKGGILKVPELTSEQERKIEKEIEEIYHGYYDDELEADVLEVTDELKDLGIFDEYDVEIFNGRSDLITVLINYLKKKEADGD